MKLIIRKILFKIYISYLTITPSSYGGYSLWDLFIYKFNLFVEETVSSNKDWALWMNYKGRWLVVSDDYYNLENKNENWLTQRDQESRVSSWYDP